MSTLAELEAYFIRYGEREEDGDFATLDGKTRASATAKDWLKRWEEIGKPTVKLRHMQRFNTRVETLAEGQGIFMMCPLCFQKNKGAVGTHWVDVTFAGRGVPDHLGSHNDKGKPTRWSVIGGTGLNDLALSPSILLLGGCNWHGFVGSSGVPPGHAR